MTKKLKKGDQVQVLSGKDKGKKGKIEKIFYQKGLVLVPGLNQFKKHIRPQGEGKPGGIVEKSRPLPIAKVALVCPKCHQPARVGFKIGKNKQKHRFCKKCQQIIS